MAITASRTTLGMDREVARESASSRGRASLLRKGLRQAKKEKNYEKALQFAAGLEGEGQAYGMTGSADDVSSISRGRIASREALVNQMRSQMPAMAGRSREGNIAAAKAAGTFNATRERFNTANAGKKVMDEEGNIFDAPPEKTSTDTTTTAAKPAATPARVSVADQLINGRSVKVPMRPSEPAGQAAETTKRKGVIMDNGVNVIDDIRRGLEGDRTGAFYTKKPASPSMEPEVSNEPAATTPSPASVPAEPKKAAATSKPQQARALVADQLIKGATQEPVKSPMRPPVKSPMRPPEKAIDQSLMESRGFGSADETNPANWDFKANPAASDLPYIAGRGSDAVSRGLQVANPLTMFSTLKQGGKSALPPMMGEQPEYANANDRLKGDYETIKAATEAGYMTAKRGQDQYGNYKLDVMTPVMRDTGKRVSPWLKKDGKSAVTARAKGGPVKAGQPYLVGEEGPEIVIPDDDGEVVPNKDLKKKKTRKMLQAALSKK
jgi:hypothetical protein